MVVARNLRLGWFVRVAVGVLALVAFVTLVGWMLPIEHVASRSARFAQPVDAVYGVVTDVVQYPAWWSDVERVEVLPPFDGRARFREHTGMGPLVLEVEEATPSVRYVTRIADPDQNFGGTWTFEFASESGATRLTITENGEVYNPIFRFLSRFVFSQTATIESFLRALGSRFGETVQPT